MKLPDVELWLLAWGYRSSSGKKTAWSIARHASSYQDAADWDDAMQADGPAERVIIRWTVIDGARLVGASRSAGKPLNHTELPNLRRLAELVEQAVCGYVHAWAQTHDSSLSD